MVKPTPTPDRTTHSGALARKIDYLLANLHRSPAQPEAIYAAIIEEIPNLTRAILAVESVADRLDAQGNQAARRGHTGPHDAGWHDCQIVVAAELRTALNGETHD